MHIAPCERSIVMDDGQFPAQRSGDDVEQEPTVPAQIVPADSGSDATGTTWPSLPPVIHNGTDSTVRPSAPYGSYNPWAAGAGTSPYAPPPPGGGYYYPTGQTNRHRGPGRIPAWLYVLAVVGILAGLAIGIGVGRAAQFHGGTLGLGGSNGAATSPQITLGASSAPIVSVPGNTQSLQTSVENVVKAVLPSVVEITSTGQGQEAIGSGDILTKDGYIVTNDHVVDGFDSFTVTYANGNTATATVVGEAPQKDLAVIKVSATNLQPIAIGDSSKAQVGEFVVAIGTPLGNRNSATFGDISGLDRTESEAPDGPADQLTGMIQTSAPIAPGNSGGALVDLNGALLGIPTLGSSSGGRGQPSTDNVGFAIPSSQVSTVAQQLIKSGSVPQQARGFLGVEVQNVTPDVAAANGLSVQQGALVTGFAPDTSGQSAAQAAGIEQGDVIVAVNGQQVTNETDLAAALASQGPGTTVAVSVVRGNGYLTFQVKLGQRPANIAG
jgi:S1-C subfamily serine protease